MIPKRLLTVGVMIAALALVPVGTAFADGQCTSTLNCPGGRSATFSPPDGSTNGQCSSQDDQGCITITYNDSNGIHSDTHCCSEMIQ